MDIVRFSGGLGNQMFQYAFMEALKSRGRDVKASLGYYTRHPDAMPFSLDRVFSNIDLEYVSDAEFDEIDERWKEIKRSGMQEEFCADIENRFFWVEDIVKSPCTYQPDVFLTTDCAFVGYWQTEKYFKDIQNTVISKFEFTNVNQELNQFAVALSENEYTSVHVRRGDYLMNPGSYMGICTVDYYLRAIDYIRCMEPDSRFIFFSDDLKWVKENIKISDAIYCKKDMFDDYEDWYDMYLMSRCSHNIIANSSFSWWGAWLNQNAAKIVVAPDKWLGYSDTPDIWCGGWVRLQGSEGRKT